MHLRDIVAHNSTIDNRRKIDRIVRMVILSLNLHAGISCQGRYHITRTCTVKNDKGQNY